jgi:hypothetical protein
MKNNRYTGRPSLKWLFEQADAEADKNAAAPDSVSAEKIAALWKLPYAEFVEQLKVVAKDPKLRAFLAAGKKDGVPGDEGVTVAAKTIAGSALSPTQSEIDLSNSIAWPFKNPGSIAAFYAGPWKGGDPIITAGGKWVIDGHHRWSSAMVFNPNVQLLCIDIGISDPEMALKMTQAAIATTKGNIPNQAVKAGMNIYAMGVNDIINKFAGGSTFLASEVVDELKNKLEVSAQPQEIEMAKQIASKQPWATDSLERMGVGANQVANRQQATLTAAEDPGEQDFGGMGRSPDDQGAIGGGYLREATLGSTGTTDYVQLWSECAATLAHNCKTLPAAGQFPRTMMPQTGTGDGGPGPEDLGKELQSGDINFKPGYDIQKESVRFDLDRWKLLAGINKRG